MSASRRKTFSQSPSPPFHHTAARHSPSSGSCSAIRPANQPAVSGSAEASLPTVPALTSRPQTRLHSDRAGTLPAQTCSSRSGPVPAPSRLGRRAEAVEQAGIGKILGEEAQELGSPEGFQEPGEAEPDRLAVVAGDDRQQGLGLAPDRVAPVEQAGGGTVDRLHDAGDLHPPQRRPRALADLPAQGGGLGLAEFRQRDLDGLAPRRVADGAPADLCAREARAMAGELGHPVRPGRRRGSRPPRPSSPSRPRRRHARAGGSPPAPAGRHPRSGSPTRR